MKKIINMLLVIVLLFSLSLNATEVNASSIVLPKVGTLSGVDDNIISIDFSHDDKYIVTGHKYGKISIWNSRNATLVTSWEDGATRNSDINNVIYSNDSSKVITTNIGGWIKIWDTISGNLIHKIDSTMGSRWTAYVDDIILNDDNSVLYSANESRKSVILWDMSSGDMIEEITFTTSPKSLAYNPIENQIAILTNDGTLNIRDAVDGSYILAIPGKDLRGNIKYTSDYKTLITTRLIKQPILFDVTANYKIIELNEDDYKAKKGDSYKNIRWEDFDLSSNDRYLVGEDYSTQYIFDYSTRKLISEISGSKPVKFNNGGDRLLAENLLYDTSQLPDRETIGIETVVKSKTMKTNESQEILVKELFSDGSSKELKLSDVNFTNVNPEIAEIIYGKVSSHKEGTAIITAEYRGFRFDLEIIVQDYQIFDKEHNVPVDKTWDIKFNMNVDIKTIKENNIYIADDNGNILPMLYYFEKGEETNIKLIPVKNYKSGESYTIWVKEIESESGSKLKSYTKKEFQIK